MVYVKRNARGEVVGVSREPVAPASAPDGEWVIADDDAPELIAFAHALTKSSNPLASSDLGVVRVLEDLIDLLVARAVIRFTDLPPAAQAKLMERRGARAAMHDFKLFDDDSGGVL